MKGEGRLYWLLRRNVIKMQGTRRPRCACLVLVMNEQLGAPSEGNLFLKTPTPFTPQVTCIAYERSSRSASLYGQVGDPPSRSKLVYIPRNDRKYVRMRHHRMQFRERMYGSLYFSQQITCETYWQHSWYEKGRTRMHFTTVGDLELWNELHVCKRVFPFTPVLQTDCLIGASSHQHEPFLWPREDRQLR